MRSVSQIYSEAVEARNNYLQLTELNSGRSNSKLSMINLLTYIMAVCIYTYEAVLDAFEVRVAKILTGRINGTPDWYAKMALKFQYNDITGAGDELTFNEDTLKVEYVTTDSSHRIVERSAWQTNDDGNSITLKVCKANSNDTEVSSGIPYTQLSKTELTAFKTFIQQIKFVGANIACESLPGDILTIVAGESSPIYYNDSYVTASQALTAIQEAMVDYVENLEYNEMLYYQSVIDIICKADNISGVSSGIKIYLTQYDPDKGAYGDRVELTGRLRLKSGYIRLLDENSGMTINDTNLTLVAASKMTD